MMPLSYWLEPDVIRYHLIRKPLFLLNEWLDGARRRLLGPCLREKELDDMRGVASYVPPLRDAVYAAACLSNEMGYEGADFPPIVWRTRRKLVESIRRVPGQSELCGHMVGGEIST